MEESMGHSWIGLFALNWWRPEADWESLVRELLVRVVLAPGLLAAEAPG